jgi:hypothetical protein
MSVFIKNKAGLFNEIKNIYKNNQKSTYIPLECNTLCGFSVKCQLLVTSTTIRLDIESKNQIGQHDSDDNNTAFDLYLCYPSNILFSKYERIDFKKETNNNPFSIDEWYSIIKQNKKLVDEPITSIEIENAIMKLIQILDSASFDTKYKKINFVTESPPSLTDVQECCVCFEDTNWATDCKHQICLPCMEQLHIRNDRHFMTNDCPLCLDNGYGY